MREIVLDTETTGLDPLMGDRVVEIGCIELINHMPTGRTFHRYLNPDRDMPEEAFRVHGLSAEFLSDKPRFHEVADDFAAFLADAPLVIHNGAFDLKFLNAEFARMARAGLSFDRLIDTLDIARRRYPGAPNSLDALCRRFGIDLSGREKHGAVVDCQLLAEVYLELVGGRQPGLALVTSAVGLEANALRFQARPTRPVRPPRPHAPTPEEIAAHAAFVASLPDPIWNQ